MFFPLLRTKQYEVLAVRHLAASLVQAGNVLPVFEPVKDQWKNLSKISAAGLTIGVITNPRVGQHSPPKRAGGRLAIPFPAAAPAVFALGNVIPAMIIDKNTTPADVATFVAAYPRRMYVVNEPPASRTPVHPFASAVASNPAYVLVRHRAVTPPANRAVNVDLDDYFIRQDNNSLYPLDEFYSDRHVTITRDTTYGHFGDYSIQGDHYREGGGPAGNVAIHHVYLIGPKPSDLRIRHFVSAAHPDVTVMWHDALSQLVADLPARAALTPLNETPVCNEYRALHVSRAFPGLGKMKEYALRHHLSLMTVAQ